MDTWHLDPGIALSDCGMLKRYFIIIFTLTLVTILNFILIILLVEFIDVIISLVSSLIFLNYFTQDSSSSLIYNDCKQKKYIVRA